MSFQPRLSVLCAGMLTAAALLSSTATLAHNYKGDYKNEVPCIQPLMLKDGFYVGAQVGFDSYNIKARHNGTVFNNSFTTAANGWVGGLFAGYGMYFSNYYYLAGEIFGNGSSASRSNFNTVTNSALYGYFQTNASVNGSWGVSVLPGLKVNDSTLAYIRLGYNQANFSGKSYSTLTTPGVAPINNSSSGNSGWEGGFNFGLGMETAIYQNVSVRGEFTHTNYSSFTNNYRTTFSPADNQYMLGLIYHFA
ncbi:MAG: outer membrane beta-barrel protein [Gammaproteobacteria bacterium]|nr:outer membrane beta-barrel protein [Gammaproteobacteria bacterium]